MVLIICGLVSCTAAPYSEQSVAELSGDSLLIISALQGGENIVQQLWPESIVYIIDEKNNQMPITSLGLNYFSMQMDWSYDNLWVVYTTTAPNNSDDILKFSNWPDQDRQISFAPDAQLYSLSWSPIDYMILYEKHEEIYSLDVNCLHRNTECNFAPLFVTYGSNPVWSHDGRSIAFVGLRDHENEEKIYVMDLESSNIIQIASPEGEKYCNFPQWSFDDSFLSYECARNIYINDVNENDFHFLAEGYDVKWSPVDNRIAFIGGNSLDANLGRDIGFGYGDAPARRSSAVFIISADGTGLKRITIDDYQAISTFLWVRSDVFFFINR